MNPVYYIARFHPSYMKYWWWTSARTWSPKPEDARAYHSAEAATKRANSMCVEKGRTTFFMGCGAPSVIMPTAYMPRHRGNAPAGRVVPKGGEGE